MTGIPGNGEGIRTVQCAGGSMAPDGDAYSDRLTVLERRVKDLEALVKGLTEELLDVKAIAMRLAKASEDRTRADARTPRPSGQVKEEPATVVLRRGQKPIQEERASERAQEPAAPVPREKVEMIMQPDGT